MPWNRINFHSNELLYCRAHWGVTLYSERYMSAASRSKKQTTAIFQTTAEERSVSSPEKDSAELRALLELFKYNFSPSHREEMREKEKQLLGRSAFWHSPGCRKRETAAAAAFGIPVTWARLTSKQPHHRLQYIARDRRDVTSVEDRTGGFYET